MAIPGRYHQSWLTRNGPGDARPTALQIVEDEGLVGGLAGKTAVITGCSSGIGIEAARALHKAGATVFATARNMDKLKEVIADIEASDPGNDAPIVPVHMDLVSLKSVRDGAKAILERSGGKVNILITNAGVMATPEGRTEDGFETQFGTNHVAHFLLFILLKDALLAASTPEFNSVRTTNALSTIVNKLGRGSSQSRQSATAAAPSSWATTTPTSPRPRTTPGSATDSPRRPTSGWPTRSTAATVPAACTRSRYTPAASRPGS
jgi:NAD(P)-dependent dehydrogenase (short-subunit alcohol dehydrogenase family)